LVNHENSAKSSLQCSGNGIWETLGSKIFRGRMPQNPLQCSLLRRLPRGSANRMWRMLVSLEGLFWREIFWRKLQRKIFGARNTNFPVWMVSHIKLYLPSIAKPSLHLVNVTLSKTHFPSHLSFLSCCYDIKSFLMVWNHVLDRDVPHTVQLGTR
jgi:hypothetical protein